MAELTEQAADFAREGIADEARVMLVLDHVNLDTVRAMLGPPASEVDFEGMPSLGRNPGRIISALHDWVGDPRSEGRSLRVLGEPMYPSRTDDEISECQRTEELLNLVFAGTDDLRLVCAYDIAALDPVLVDAALQSHPVFRIRDVAKRSLSYRGVDDHHDAPLTRPPAGVVELGFTADDLRVLRSRVAALASSAGLPPGRTEDIVLATNEAAINSIIHGGGAGTLRMWTAGDAVVTELEDEGVIDSPLAGRLRPAEIGSAGGHGLWLTHQVCDLVQVRSSARGTTVRMRVGPLSGE